MISRRDHFITRFVVSWFFIMLYNIHKFPGTSFWFLLAHAGTAALFATLLVEAYIAFRIWRQQ